jgi:ribose transport system ATP-binding protein
MEGISKAFPGVQALDRVDLDVQAGEVLALLGENGAGKSTLMKILSGAIRKDAGRILLGGREVEIDGPPHSQRLGIATIYQEFTLARNQTVAANIFMAREPLVRGPGRLLRLVDRRAMEVSAREVLARIQARVPPDAKVGALSVAQQQMVEIARALAKQSQLIIMDEPTAALGEKETQILFRTVEQLGAQGVAIIFITHRLEEVFHIAHRAVVLRDGQRVGEVPIADATPDLLVQMMVGRTLREVSRREAATIGTPVLEVRGLSRGSTVDGVSFVLHRGEILGFAGLVGAGRTETMRLIFGVDRPDAGVILVDGQPASFASAHDALEAGIGLVPEDRALQGLVLSLAVRENIVLPTLDRHAAAGWVNRASTQATAVDYVDRLRIRTPHLAQKAMLLSGGNQQKIVLAKWLASNPKVLILDEPTRGIDVATKAEVHALMSQLARSGMGILMVSSELPEILAMSDRIVVMREGRVVAVLDRAEATQENIITYATGPAGVSSREGAA